MILASNTFQHLLLDANMDTFVVVVRSSHSSFLPFPFPSLSLTDPLIPFELTWGEMQNEKGRNSID